MARPRKNAQAANRTQPTNTTPQSTSGAGTAVALEPYLFNPHEAATIRGLTEQSAGLQAQIAGFIAHVISTRHLPESNWRLRDDLTGLMPSARGR